jgi:O6-methylguanine-DNA--protein-cysteine methyltransferase
MSALPRGEAWRDTNSKKLLFGLFVTRTRSCISARIIEDREMKRFLVMAVGGVLCSTIASAQSAETEGALAPDGAAAAQEAAPAAGAAAAVEVTDAEIESFAQATVKLQAIDADASLQGDQKQAAMAAAVKQAGLEPAKYNQIAQAVGTDTALRAKVVEAMGRAKTPTAPAG